MKLTLLSLQGSELQPYLDALGQLRITVFRDYPYLYDGSLADEREYLQTYLNSPRSHITLVLDAERVVGATTCMPLAEEGPPFQQPFLQAGMSVEQVCYLGESILLSQYRGQGLGKAFFAQREAHAQKLGLPITAFCAVDRPTDHPLLPADYVPLDGMWSRLGYQKQPHLQAVFHWKEIHEEEESPKTLTFWLKQQDDICPPLT